MWKRFVLISDFLCRILKRFISAGFRISKINHFVASSELFFRLAFISMLVPTVKDTVTSINCSLAIVVYQGKAPVVGCFF